MAAPAATSTGPDTPRVPGPVVSPPVAGPVLYLTHRVPFPPDKGDRIRNYHLLRQLAARGRVWLGTLADEPVSVEARAELGRLAERVAVVPVDRSRWLRAGASLTAGRSLSEGAFASPALRRVVRGWAAERPLAAAVVSASSLAPYLTESALAGVPRFVDLVDVDSQKWADYAAAAAGPRRWLYRLEAARVRKLERSLPGRVGAVAVVSRAEAAGYDGFTHPGAATVATNGVDLDYFAPAAGLIVPYSCAFVGAMDYRPNVDGAVWFARAVWPLIREKWPAATFAVVGRNPAAEVRRLAGLPGVSVVGGVPDVRPHVAGAAAVVVPLRIARGVQNKVLEALAMAKAVVAAPAALNGVSAEPGRHLLAAATPAGWVAALGGLFAGPARAAALGAAGRAFVEQYHHWDKCLAPLVDQIAPG